MVDYCRDSAGVGVGADADANCVGVACGSSGEAGDVSIACSLFILVQAEALQSCRVRVLYTVYCVELLPTRAWRRCDGMKAWKERAKVYRRGARPVMFAAVPPRTILYSSTIASVVVRGLL